jgi:phage terminase small subunit
MFENVRSEQQLTPKQAAFIAALLSLPTIIAAAKAAGVTDKTARVWMRQPYMQDALRAARKQAFDAVIDSLQDSAGEAKETLRAIMSDTDAPPAVRVRAAQILLELSLQSHKMSDIQEQLAEVKAIVKART